MKAIEEFKREVQDNFSIDDVVDEITDKIKMCVESRWSVNGGFRYLTLMQGMELVEKSLNTSIGQYDLTKKASELYKRLKEEDYYSEQKS